MLRSILLVDDDQKTRLLLKTYLEKQQYEVHAAHDGGSFLSAFEILKAELSLVILDVMLPDTDGFTLCKTVRQKSKVPIIMLTASADETDRIVGLEIGADDYIAKPYNPRELLARIKAVLRRAQPGAYSARRALQMSPELWKWDQEQNESIATGLATAMCQRNPKLSQARARMVALVSVQTVVALLDLACLDPRRGSAIIEEAITLRAAYLSPYLDK